jgi:hypothetical protein
MIKLLGNSAELEKRIERYNAAKTQAEQTIALAGKASEIVQIREDINADLAEAKQLLEDARAQAQAIVADGRKRAEQLVQEANVQVVQQTKLRDKAVEETAAAHAAARKEKDEAARQMALALAAQNTAEDAMSQATARAEEASAVKLAFEDRLKVLQGIQEQFADALSKA